MEISVSLFDRFVTHYSIFISMYDILGIPFSINKRGWNAWSLQPCTYIVVDMRLVYQLILILRRKNDQCLKQLDCLFFLVSDV